MGAMVLNIAANMLGLSNAATPLGLRAMRDLASDTGATVYRPADTSRRRCGRIRWWGRMVAERGSSSP